MIGIPALRIVNTKFNEGCNPNTFEIRKENETDYK